VEFETLRGILVLSVRHFDFFDCLAELFRNNVLGAFGNIVVVEAL
jgi:hypothetical protein